MDKVLVEKPLSPSSFPKLYRRIETSTAHFHEKDHYYVKGTSFLARSLRNM